MNQILLLVFGYSFLARSLRWLSLWQQKEYRLDRFLAYLRSSQGRASWRQILDFPLSKTQLRRPKLTGKSVIILVTYFAIVLAIRPDSVISLAGTYLLVPVLIVVATGPAALISKLVESYYIAQAGAKIRQHKPRVIGVGGSYGKTTTKILIGHVLSAKYKVWTSPKSHNTPYSIARAICNSYAGEEIVVLEYAAYKRGEIAALAKSYPPNQAVFTGINLQHLALFGSIEDVYAGETELFASLSQGSQVVYNHQDTKVVELIEAFADLKLIPSSQSAITSGQVDSSGRLVLLQRGELPVIKTRLVGRHYLVNCQMAQLVATNLGVDSKDISQKLSKFQPPAEFITTSRIGKSGLIVWDDRTSNPSGFSASLDLIKSLDEYKRKILVFGGIVDLGSESGRLHQQFAQASRSVFDKVIYTSDVGSGEFQSVFGADYYLCEQADKLKQLDLWRLGESLVILVEGHIPPSINNYLKQLSVDESI